MTRTTSKQHIPCDLNGYCAENEIELDIIDETDSYIEFVTPEHEMGNNTLTGLKFNWMVNVVTDNFRENAEDQHHLGHSIGTAKATAASFLTLDNFRNISVVTLEMYSW